MAGSAYTRRGEVAALAAAAWLGVGGLTARGAYLRQQSECERLRHALESARAQLADAAAGNRGGEVGGTAVAVARESSAPGGSAALGTKLYIKGPALCLPASGSLPARTGRFTKQNGGTAPLHARLAELCMRTGKTAMEGCWDLLGPNLNEM